LKYFHCVSTIFCHFFGKAHIGYYRMAINGLSKIARVAEAYSRRLQVRKGLLLKYWIVYRNFKSAGCCSCHWSQNLCMVMRGIQKQNSVTTTSAFTGEFLNNTKQGRVYSSYRFKNYHIRSHHFRVLLLTQVLFTKPSIRFPPPQSLERNPLPSFSSLDTKSFLREWRHHVLLFPGKWGCSFPWR